MRGEPNGRVEGSMPNTGREMRDDRLIEVVELLARGAWQEAHGIVQQDKSPEAAWLHGIVHTLEGDFENARHWYREEIRTFIGAEAVHGQLAIAREVLMAKELRVD